MVKHYQDGGRSVRSVERDKCGFDLECTKGAAVEQVEVKGVSGSGLCFVLTAGELKQANDNPRFVLVVVTSRSPRRPCSRSSRGGVRPTIRLGAHSVQGIPEEVSVSALTQPPRNVTKYAFQHVYGHADISRNGGIHNQQVTLIEEPVAMDLPISELSADQRLTQLAAILARGVQRYHRRLRRSESRPEKEVPESLPAGLEVSGNPRLSGSRCIGV